MNGRNYVVFHSSSADDSYMNSTENFRGADVGATFIDLFFAAAVSGSSLATSGYDKVRLTVTAAQEENALEAIVAGLSGAKNPLTVMVDDRADKQIFIHSGVTAATITLATQANTKVVENFLPGGDGTGASDNANTKQLTASDSGKTFITEIHTNTAAYRLPAVAGNAGTHYTFIISFASDAEAVKDMIISTNANGENIMGAGIDGGAVHDNVKTTSVITYDSSASGGDSSGASSGDRLSCVCDGTHWYITDCTANPTATWVVADNAI